MLSSAAVAGPNCVGSSSTTARSPQISKPLTLRVVLYPFVPGFSQYKNEVKSRFEQKYPDIQVEIIDLSDNYYGSFAPDYIGCANADVYELDSVFLYDFALNGKIQRLPPSTAEPPSNLLKNAALGSVVNGDVYGAPHWVCGNFLFFDTADTKMRGLRTLRQLRRVIGPSPTIDRGLAVDLMGKSTLGEFYLNAAFDRYGDLESARRHLALYDTSLKDDLVSLSGMCASEGCRQKDNHGTSFFAEEFAERRARAFVGYSESLATALAASANAGKCKNSLSACRTDKEFDAEALPLDDKGTRMMSWVDSFAVDSNCKAQCATAAAEFIRFVTSDEMFLLELLPPGSPPTYLLPAKMSLYSNRALLAKAHLYPKLKNIIQDAAVPSALGLNEQLRNIGRQLDSDLPH